MRKLWMGLAFVSLPLLVQSQAGDEPLTLNFRGVDILDIVESVGELTGKNFLVDPRVRGKKVTIIANDPISESEVYDVFLSVLRSHGFRAVESEHLTRIVPGNVAPRYTPEKGPDALTTEIIPVRHLIAASVIPILKQMMTPEAQVVAHKETNYLIITEVGSNLTKAKRILSRIDVPTLEDYEIIDLRHIDAVSIHKMLREVGKQGPLRTLVNIISDEDTNRLILTGHKDMRLRIRALIAELDTPSSASGLSGTLQIIPLRYAKAEELTTILRDLLSSDGFLKSLGGTGSYTITQTGGTQTTPKPPAAKKDAPPQSKTDASSKTPADRTVRVSGRKSDRDYTIEFDEATNSLIVGGSPKIIDVVLYVVNKLDVPRPQVLIEAIIADISDNQAANISIQLGQGANLSLPGTGDGINNVIASQDYNGFILGLVGGNTNKAFRTGVIGTAGGARISLLVDAIRDDRNSNVLSTPSILTLNNEEAMIDVSDKRYIQTGSSSAGGSSSSTVGAETFGTLLKVTPQITEGRAVRLDIEQQTEDITGQSPDTGFGSFPTSTVRRLDTTVVVNSGDILVLGGLIKGTRQENEVRIPLLSSIPILGHLFRDRSSSDESQTLIIFIRPTILRTPEDSYEFSKEKYAKLRMQQLLYSEEIKSLIKDEGGEKTSIVPDIETMEAERRRASDLSESEASRNMDSAANRNVARDAHSAAPGTAAPIQKKRRVVKRIIRRRPAETL